VSEVVRVSRNETRQRKISLVSLMIQRVASYESHEDKASMSFYKDELNGAGSGGRSGTSFRARLPERSLRCRGQKQLQVEVESKDALDHAQCR
jgi:hypothetical protein